MKRKNPILQKPPTNMHGLQKQNILTTRGWPDPRIGVNTANTELIAAFYAQSAFDGLGAQKTPQGYPVIVELDVTNLTKEPDVDGLLWWYDIGKDVAASGDFETDWDDIDPKNVWEFAASPHYLANPTNWEEVDSAVLKAAIEGDLDAIKIAVLAAFPQQRYFSDFSEDRVIALHAFKPIHTHVFEDWDETPRWVEVEEAKGWSVVAETDSPLEYVPNLTEIARFSGNRKEGEYHGTVSYIVEAALEKFANIVQKHEPHFALKP